ASAALIGVSASSTNVAVGDTVDINFDISGLSLAAGDSLSAFDFDILYDDSAFSFTGFSFADPLLGNQLDLPIVGSLGFSGDVVAIGSGSLDAYGTSGNPGADLDADQVNGFRFLSLSFSAIAETSSCLFEIDLADPQLLVLDSDFGDLSVSYQSSGVAVAVSNSANVSEPGSVLLFVLGMMMLLIAERSLKMKTKA
ncbi:MAG: hypothetical protein PVI92_12165, partial [Chromatiales bacterium]